MGETSRNDSEKVRRLSIHGNCQNLLPNKSFPCLRSLLFFISLGSSLNFTNKFFSRFSILRVVELEGAPIAHLPPEIFELLHLRYLSLRRTQIRKLPDSIRKLKNLEVLDLKASGISSIPVGILQLKNICQLRNFHYRFESSIYYGNIYGMRLPTGIGRLTSLQKLGTVDVDNDIELIRELKKLTELRRLGVLNLAKQHGDAFCHSVENLKHLTTLYMLSKDTGSEIIELESLSSPPEFLQRLYVKCRLVAVPTWLASLNYLVKLVLQYSNLRIDPLKALQGLPSLVILELRQAYKGDELCSDNGGYRRLRQLFLHHMVQLKSVRIAEGAMLALKALDIAACHQLKVVPTGIEHLHSLKTCCYGICLLNCLKEYRETVVMTFGEFNIFQQLPVPIEVWGDELVRYLYDCNKLSSEFQSMMIRRKTIMVDRFQLKLSVSYLFTKYC